LSWKNLGTGKGLVWSWWRNTEHFGRLDGGVPRTAVFGGIVGYWYITAQWPIYIRFGESPGKVKVQCKYR